MADSSIAVLPSPEPLALPVATDKIGTDYYQWMRLSWGAVGIHTPTEDSNIGRIPIGGKLLTAVIAVDAGTGSDDEAITGAAAGLELHGFSALETAGAAASFIFHNGVGNGDPATYIVSLASGESRGEFFPKGIVSAAGIWLERVTGSARVVVFHKTVT